MTSDVDDDDLKSNDDDDSWAENELPDDEKDEVDDDTFALHLMHPLTHGIQETNNRLIM